MISAHMTTKRGTGTMPYRVEKDGGIWRMVYDAVSTSDGPGPEEVVASLQGILSKNGLPPFLENIG
jgi:hypothetical protein